MLETILQYGNKSIYVSNIWNHINECKRMINIK